MIRWPREKLTIGIFVASLFFSISWTTAQEAPPPSLNRQLIQAVARGQVDEVSALLTAGADPTWPLLIAAKNGQAEIFKLLMAHGARLTGTDNLGMRALGMALYSSNAQVQERDAKKQTPRWTENKGLGPNGGGHDEIIKVILEHGVPADSPNELGMTLLMEATMYGNEAAVTLLLDHGARVDAELKDGGGTALFHAAMLGHGTIVELLLVAGASPNKVDETKATPLLVAACSGNADASALALGGEAKGYGFVDRIRGNEYGRAVRALLKANADVNAAGKREVTPLMAASVAGDLGIVASLLDAGANPNLRNPEGRTALMFAAKVGKAPLVELLLSEGADPKAVALDGKTALSFAKAGKSRETIRLLQKAIRN